MTLRHMKIFVSVYQTQSITRAAEQLHMTQPAVSRAIQELEHYYGVCLFERIGRRICSTESAARLYAQALHIIETLDSMEKGLRDWDEFGVLRVGATITLGNFLLPELAARFQQRLPHLQLRAVVSNGAQLSQHLLENTIDLALIEGSILLPQLVSEPFSGDHLQLILPPGHPLSERKSLSLEELAEEPFLLRERGSAGREFLDHVFAAHQLPLTPLWESASTQAIIKAVGAGLGVSFLPEKLVSQAIAEGSVRTVPIENEPFCRTHHIVYHRHKFLTQSAREFIALCHEMEASADVMEP